jgi:hypothetical protein
MLYSHRRVSPISRFAANWDPEPRFRVPTPGQIGKRGISRFPIPSPAESGIADSLPDSRPNRESGERELGIFGSGLGFRVYTPPTSATYWHVLSWNVFVC